MNDNTATATQDHDMTRADYEHPVFGKVISRYTRAQGIADGVLVDVTNAPGGPKEARITVPVAMTAAAYATCVALTPAAKRACNDLTGRMWDVSWMLSLAMRRPVAGDTLTFQVMCVTTSTRPSKVTLKAQIHGGDHGEPVLTVRLANELTD